MATLAELKTRVIAELNRDDMGTGADLETVLATTIDRAIEFYADEDFWFTRMTGTTATVNATATAALPTGMRIPVTVSYLQQKLLQSDLADIQYLTDTGLPTRWAEVGGLLHLWPIPNAVYSLSVQGIAELGTPVTSNAWTVQAYDLIAARVRFVMLRDVLRDAEGVSFAKQAVDEAFSGLKRETQRRQRTPLRSLDTFAAPQFNITRGW